ncbi:hypothetical protein Y1Q_0015619 [Alligator mississippiensis]|uniref:StAR-related lipid transfer protein 8 n=1 Tax=Alligator mississippiensis TaxID=8496 RepID=A0A151NNE2_ALLMI|nr:hypothetical protein Y1Q_0015619 [Alligator mississippiensis]
MQHGTVGIAPLPDSIRQSKCSISLTENKDVGSSFPRECSCTEGDTIQPQEIEAKEACDWLRAAGFPQYAQLYEASLFPIDITSVKTDHSFLDEDSLTSLCRRLMTLNTCATMKLEVHCEQKQNEDSDEDVCAISNRWTFQKDSKRWSRIGSVESLSHSSEVLITVKEASSHESVLTDLSTNMEAASLHSNTSTGSTGDTLCSVVTMPDLSPNQDSAVITFTSSSQSLTDKSQDQTGSSKDKLKKRRSRSFLRRIESFRRKKKEKTDSRPKEATSDETATEPECDSVEANGDIIAAKPTSPRQRMSPSLLDKNLFLSGGDGVEHVSDLKGNKTGCQLKNSGVDLEQRRKVLVNGTSSSIGESHQWHPYSDYLIHIPADHKPGTFPKSLSIESLCHPCDRSLTNWTPGNKAREFSEFSLDDSSSGSADSPQMSSGSRRRRNSCSSISSIMSVYDNVPQGASSKEQLDSVLEYVLHLVERVDSWYQAIIPMQDSEAGRREETDSGGEVERKEKTDLGREAERKVKEDLGGEAGRKEETDSDGEAERKEETDSGEEPAFLSGLNLEKQSMSDVGTSTSDFGSTGHSLNEAEEIEMRERRDSGVGASLTRPCRKLRWYSFQNSQPCLDSASLEINCQSSAQLNLLQKCSLLRLTAIMEKDSMSQKHAWTWTVPKFMKRSKTPDYKDKMVFGVSLMVTVQRTGQPLPRGIQQAMLYIRSKCLDQVGIFRKSGSKSRIQALRDLNEASPNNVNYDAQSAYDVADMLKQYFRDLPEPIFTSKLTDTFLQIYQFVPAEQRLQAVQAAILLMPDANREVLQAFLYFLSDIASVEVNQMTPRNLAVCLAPSIFHLNVSSSPRVAHKKGPMGKPDQKELDENMAATQGLCHMITDCKKLFQIPKDMMLQLCNSYLAADACALPQAEPTHQNMQGECKDLQFFLDDSMQSLLKESSEKFKGWLSTPGPQNTEISCKKVGDGHPLRLWRVFTEVEAPPNTVLYRILRERHLWDKDLLQSNVIETLENNMEIYHYVTGSMPPQPHRDFILFRKWHTDLPQGTCLLVSTSMDCEKLKVEGGVRAMVLTSQYLIEPCGMGRSKLTHICRADLRGRSPDWYNKAYGHICAIELARIRDSFPTLTPSGPETMV